MRQAKQRIRPRPVRKKLAKKISCKVCNQPFTPGIGMRTCWTCRGKQQIKGHKFRKVQLHRCPECGHKIELSPCAICAARKEASNAASPS